MTIGYPTDVDHAPGVGRRVQIQAKRAIDVTLSMVLLVVLAPLFLLVVAAVRLSSPGPAIFRQERLGLHQQAFTVYKFRSMYGDANPESHRQFLHDQANGACPEVDHFKVVEDPRVTPIGRFLRRTSIDELPQLVNVLRGDMSLVGPRPDLPYSLDIYAPHHYRRFEVLPGMTGLWQVSGRSKLSFVEMLDLDVAYVERWNLGFDLTILARTIPEVLAVERAG